MNNKSWKESNRLREEKFDLGEQYGWDRFPDDEVDNTTIFNSIVDRIPYDYSRLDLSEVMENVDTSSKESILKDLGSIADYIDSIIYAVRDEL